VSLEDGAHDRRGLIGLADVPGGPGRALPDLRRRPFEHVPAATGDDDVGATPRELERCCLTEVGAATGDERHAAGEGVGGEHLRRRERGHYSPSTLMTRRLGRPPSNSQ
jgi:hypothetical protein